MSEPSRLFTTSLEMTKPSEVDELIYDEELHKRFVRWKEKSGISLRKLAPMLNRSYTVIGQYLNFRYEGDLRLIEKDISKLLDRKEGHRLKSKDEEFCWISASEGIWEVFQSCYEHGEMGAVISPSGTSKTKTAEKYQDKNPSTVLLTASPTRRSFPTILRALATNVRAPSSSMALDDIMWRVVDKLRGSKRLIIIDEAQFMKWESFEVIRSIYDATGVGFTYLGTPRLYSQMRGDTRFDWDQVVSRITVRMGVNEISHEDVKAVTNSIYLGLSKSCVGFLYQVAQEPGKLRVMTDLLKKAVEFHEIDGSEITVDLLKEFKQMRDF